MPTNVTEGFSLSHLYMHSDLWQADDDQTQGPTKTKCPAHTHIHTQTVVVDANPITPERAAATRAACTRAGRAGVCVLCLFALCGSSSSAVRAVTINIRRPAGRRAEVRCTQHLPFQLSGAASSQRPRGQKRPAQSSCRPVTARRSPRCRWQAAQAVGQRPEVSAL